MKNTKFLDAEEIALEEVSDEWISVTLAGEKFVMDVDTLYDISFRFAALLAHIERREEDACEENRPYCLRRPFASGTPSSGFSGH